MAANILIVEDENAILELISLNLHQSGFNPLRAISAEIADSLVKNTLPDLIVLDWMLPGMDGITFAKRLRANSDKKKIPIILEFRNANLSDIKNSIKLVQTYNEKKRNNFK